MQRIMAGTLVIFIAAAVCEFYAVPTTSVATTQEAPFVNLWPGPAPHSLGEAKADTPALQIFLPVDGKGTGAAIIVCPGGGYSNLAAHEGGKVGQWLAENGIAGFVLRYRVGPKYHYPAELEDGQRAIRYVRAHAAEWKLDPNRVGIIGFSAGRASGQFRRHALRGGRSERRRHG